jgi:hypothetical protein
VLLLRSLACDELKVENLSFPGCRLMSAHVECGSSAARPKSIFFLV